MKNGVRRPLISDKSTFGFDNHLRHSWLERVDDGYVAVDGERHEGEDGHGHREERDEVVHRAVPSPERPVSGRVRKKGYDMKVF